jgi:hypothetical protein
MSHNHSGGIDLAQGSRRLRVPRTRRRTRPVAENGPQLRKEDLRHGRLIEVELLAVREDASDDSIALLGTESRQGREPGRVHQGTAGQTTARTILLVEHQLPPQRLQLLGATLEIEDPVIQGVDLATEGAGSISHQPPPPQRLLGHDTAGEEHPQGALVRSREPATTTGTVQATHRLKVEPAVIVLKPSSLQPGLDHRSGLLPMQILEQQLLHLRR